MAQIRRKQKQHQLILLPSLRRVISSLLLLFVVFFCWILHRGVHFDKQADASANNVPRRPDNQETFNVRTYNFYDDYNLSMFSIPAQSWNREPSLKATAFNFKPKIYVYDNLPPKISSQVEDCLLDTYTNTVDHVENFKAELGLIYLFRTTPFRTHNPQEADLFVVPYAAEGHCQCSQGYTWDCAQVQDGDIRLLLDSLMYFNESTKQRHVFILAGAQAKRELWSMPLRLTTAPVAVIQQSPTSGQQQIVIPNLEDKAPYQPSSLLQRGTQWWTSRTRKYAFSFIYGGRNSKIKASSGRKFRDFLEEDIKTNYADGKVARKDFYIQRWSSPHDFHKLETFAIYNESLLCPCLPGDLAWQKRFFDAILNGCLPLVLQFDTPNLPGGKTWFLPENNKAPQHSSVQQTYPFAKGAFPDSRNTQIDYESFVVEVPMNAFQQKNVSGIMKAVEQILENPNELRRRQLIMMKYATYFTYGMGPDAHKYDDAFRQIVRALRYYVHTLD